MRTAAGAGIAVTIHAIGDAARMIAAMGYVVFAEDIFGKGVVPKEVPQMTALTDIYNKDRPKMRTRSRAGFDVLAKNAMVDAAKIAVIGYCFGGTVAWWGATRSSSFAASCDTASSCFVSSAAA